METIPNYQFQPLTEQQRLKNKSDFEMSRADLLEVNTGLRLNCDWTKYVTPRHLVISNSRQYDHVTKKMVFKPETFKSETQGASYAKAEDGAVHIHLALKREQYMAETLLSTVLASNTGFSVIRAKFFPHGVRTDIFWVVLYVHVKKAKTVRYMLAEMPTVGTRIGLKVPAFTCALHKHDGGFFDDHNTYFSGEIIDNIWGWNYKPKGTFPSRLFAAVRGVNLPAFNINKKYTVEFHFLGKQITAFPTTRQLRAINDIVISTTRDTGPKIPQLILNAEPLVEVDTAWLAKSFRDEAAVAFVLALKTFSLSEKQMKVALASMTSQTSVVAFSHSDPVGTSVLLGAIALGHAFCGRRVLFVAPTISRMDRAISHLLTTQGMNMFHAHKINVIRFVGAAYNKSEENLYSNSMHPSKEKEPSLGERVDNEAVDEQWAAPFINAEAENRIGMGVGIGYHSRLCEAAYAAVELPQSPIHGASRVYASTVDKLVKRNHCLGSRKMLCEILFRNEKIIRDYLFMHHTDIIFTTCQLAAHPALDHFDVDVVVMHDKGQVHIGTSSIPFAAARDLKLAVIGGDHGELTPYLASHNRNEGYNWINHSLLTKVMRDRQKRWETFDLDVPGEL